MHPGGKIAGQVERCFDNNVVNLGIENFFEIIRVHDARLLEGKRGFYGWSG
jgi:hypothetical protein